MAYRRPPPKGRLYSSLVVSDAVRLSSAMNPRRPQVQDPWPFIIATRRAANVRPYIQCGAHSKPST